jgi:hypothetical protein
MGSEGQNNPNNTSGAERKRPWEIFPEEEIDAIKINEKYIDRRERSRIKLEKNKTRILRIKHFLKNHKMLFFSIIFALILFSVVIFFGMHYLLKIEHDQNMEEQDEVDEPSKVIVDWPFENVSVKDLPTPNIALNVVMARLKPVLREGAFDTGTINFSKIEDNYEAFIKNIDSEYDRICYRLAMINIMYAFDSDFGSNRASFLLDRFDEQKIKLDNIQNIFYLKNRIDYAAYKKDEKSEQKYRNEYNKKYAKTDSYIDLDTGEVITDGKKIDEFNKSFEKTLREVYGEEKTQQ